MKTQLKQARYVFIKDDRHSPTLAKVRVLVEVQDSLGRKLLSFGSFTSQPLSKLASHGMAVRKTSGRKPRLKYL